MKLLINQGFPGWETLFGHWLKNWDSPPSGWTAHQLLEHSQLEQAQSFGWLSPSGLTAVVLGREISNLFEVDYLATHPQWRRLGQMSLLMTALISQPQLKELWLEVHAENYGAQSLYKKLGLKKVGRRGAYYPDGADCYLYSLKK